MGRHTALAAVLTAMLVVLSTSSAAAVDQIGHRGAASYRPENTIPAIRVAASRGARWAEVDVRVSATGTPWLMHDAYVGATTTGRGRLRSLRDSAIRALRATARWPETRPDVAAYDGRFRVPRLARAVDDAAAAGVGLVVDMKTTAGKPKIAGILRNAPGPVLVAPLSATQHRWFVDNTRLRLVWPGEPGDWAPPTWRQTDAVTVNRFDLTRWRTDWLHARGVDVWVWTLRPENRWLPEAYRAEGGAAVWGDLPGYAAQFVAMGVDGVSTDAPGF